MMRLAAILWAPLVVLWSVAQPVPPSAEPDPAVTRLHAAWSARLTALDPAQPMQYFLLGEEVADETKDGPSIDLARRLFVLAYELDVRAGVRGAEPRLGPSVCLALASLTTREDERRWLRALAETLVERPSSASAPAADLSSPWPLDTAFDLATAMGLARSGEGRRAEQLLAKPGVSELLKEIDALPMPDGRPGSISGFLTRATRDWPVCPQCRNRRVVPRGGPGGARQGESVLCDTCRGNPGPTITEEEMANHLRIEAVLLQGEQRSWAAQMVADAGAPLRDLDPAELAATYGVDPKKSIWRDGAWIGPPATSRAEPADTAEKTPGG